MTITATELKQNLGKYLLLASEEDIIVTKNGKEIVKLSNPNVDRLSLLDSMVGIIPEEEGMSLDEIREARLERK